MFLQLDKYPKFTESSTPQPIPMNIIVAHYCKSQKALAQNSTRRHVIEEPVRSISVFGKFHGQLPRNIKMSSLLVIKCVTNYFFTPFDRSLCG